MPDSSYYSTCKHFKLVKNKTEHSSFLDAPFFAINYDDVSSDQTLCSSCLNWLSPVPWQLLLEFHHYWFVAALLLFQTQQPLLNV